MRRTAALSSTILLLTLASTAREAAAAAGSHETLSARLAPALAAAARASAETQWNPRLDQMVQGAPAAAALGASWNPKSPAWQLARKALAERLTRAVAASIEPSEVQRALDAGLAKALSAEERNGLAAALDGPAGPAIVHAEAASAFIVAVISDSPDEPQPGTPAWLPRLNALRQQFDERADAAVPRDDGTHKAELDAFLGGPVGRQLSPVWSSLLGQCEVKVDGAMNRLLFDEQEALQRDLAKAVASVR